MADTSRHLLIAQLLADGSLNDTQRAEIAGCSLRTVGRVRRILREEMASDETVQERYNEYQRHLRRCLPAEARAKRLEELMTQTDQLMVALKAIQYADEHDGFVSARVQRKVAEPPAPGPMFVFPPGSRPILRVNPPPPGSQQRALDEKTSAQEPIEAEAVRISEDEDT